MWAQVELRQSPSPPETELPGATCPSFLCPAHGKALVGKENKRRPQPSDMRKNYCIVANLKNVKAGRGFRNHLDVESYIHRGTGKGQLLA